MFSILIQIVTCCWLIHLGMEDLKQLNNWVAFFPQAGICLSCFILTLCQYFFFLLIVLHWLHYSSNLSLHVKQAIIISTFQKNSHPVFSDRETFWIVSLQETNQIKNCSSAHPWGMMLGMAASWTWHHWWQQWAPSPSQRWRWGWPASHYLPGSSCLHFLKRDEDLLQRLLLLPCSYHILEKLS